MKIIEEKEDQYGIKSKVERSDDDIPKDIGPIKQEIQVGHPQVYELMEMYELENIRPPAKIRTMSKDNNFYLVDLAFSFTPEENSEFVNLKFKVDLMWDSQKDSGKNIDLPIAYDLHPIEVFDEIQEKKSMGINPSLKFASFELTTVTYLTEVSFTRIIPIITGTGALFPSIAWSFERTKEHRLIGIRDMLIIIKAPKSERSIVGKISLNGEIDRDRWRFWKYDQVEYHVDLEKGILIDLD